MHYILTMNIHHCGAISHIRCSWLTEDEFHEYFHLTNIRQRNKLVTFINYILNLIYASVKHVL